jgi:hypothetical protein
MKHNLISDRGIFFRAHIIVTYSRSSTAPLLKVSAQYSKNEVTIQNTVNPCICTLSINNLLIHLKILITTCPVFRSLDPFIHSYSSWRIKEKGRSTRRKERMLKKKVLEVRNEM